MKEVEEEVICDLAQDGKSDDDSHSSSAGVLARPNAPFLEGYLPNFLITSACSYAY